MRVALYCGRGTSRTAIEYRLARFEGLSLLLVVMHARGHKHARAWAIRNNVRCSIFGNVAVGTLGPVWSVRAAWAGLFASMRPDYLLAFGRAPAWLAKLAAKYETPIVITSSLYEGGKGKPLVPRVKELCGVKTPMGDHACDKFKDHPGDRHSWRENGKRKYEWFADFDLRRGAREKRAQSKRAKREGN
jgi:hypothetical protein